MNDTLLMAFENVTNTITDKGAAYIGAGIAMFGALGVGAGQGYALVKLLKLLLETLKRNQK